MLYRLTIRKNTRTKQREFVILPTTRRDLQITRKPLEVVYDGISLPSVLHQLSISL